MFVYESERTREKVKESGRESIEHEMDQGFFPLVSTDLCVCVCVCVCVWLTSAAGTPTHTLSTAGIFFPEYTCKEQTA